MTTRLYGLASTTGIDLEHCSFAHGSIVIPKTLPPLFLGHKKDKQVGIVRALDWMESGLVAIVDVDDMYSEIKGFSVGASLRDYEIIGKGAGAYASVTKAIMSELSITNNPCNPEALIYKRELLAAPVRERKAFVPIELPAWEGVDHKVDAIRKKIEILLNELRRS